MKPTTPMIFTALLRKFDELDESEKDPAKRSSFITMRFILDAIRRDWDDAAMMRFEEIDGLSSLLLRGAKMAPDDLGLIIKDTVTGALSAKEKPKISNLEAAIDSLKEALIRLQEWLETIKTKEAQMFLQDVLSFLYAFAQRRSCVDYQYRY